MRSLFTPPRGRGDRGVGAALAPSPRVVVSARAVVVCVLASMPLLLRWYARSLETSTEETTSLAVRVAGEFAGGARATADWSSYDRGHEDDAAAARTTASASREKEETEAAERARRAELSARAERWFHGAERLADAVTAASSSSSSSMGGGDASLESAPDDADTDAAPPDVKVVVATTTADAPDSVLRWAAYHAALGVDAFFLFLEGAAATPSNVKALRETAARNALSMMIWTPSRELNETRAASRAWNEKWLANYFDKPCNNELFVRQSLNMEIAIAAAHRARPTSVSKREGSKGNSNSKPKLKPPKPSFDWIVQIDTDELLHPAGAKNGFGIKSLLASLPPDVDQHVFPNYEACPEDSSVRDPFVDVTLFKKSYSHVSRDAYMEEYATVTRGNPNYFLTYANGKSAARVIPGLRPNGAHRFYNYGGKPKETTATEAAVLHFTYTMFDDVLKRKARCECPGDGSDEALQKCFILDFDRTLYKMWDESSEETMRRFWGERVVYGDADVVMSLLARGLFARIYTPRVLMRAVMEEGGGGEAKAERKKKRGETGGNPGRIWDTRDRDGS